MSRRVVSRRVAKIGLQSYLLCMMIGDRKTLVFSEQMQLRTTPGTREAVKEAARREGLTMAELIRRALLAATSTTAQNVGAAR